MHRVNWYQGTELIHISSCKYLGARAIYAIHCFFFFQAEDGIRDLTVTGVQTCALPILVQAASRRLALGGIGEAVGFGDDAGDRHDVFGARAPGERRRDLTGVEGHALVRSEERRGGEEGRSRGAPDQLKKKKYKDVVDRG